MSIFSFGNSSDKTDEEKKRQAYINMLSAELSANEKTISEYSSFKGAVSSLISAIETFKSNIENTHNAVLNAINYAGFEASIGKISEYAKSAGNSISALSGVIAEVTKEIETLEQRNSEIRSILY